MKLPWVSRRDHVEAVKVYDSWVNELLAENAVLMERVRYLERERESIRLASLARDPEPITVLDEHDEDIARWEGEGGA